MKLGRYILRRLVFLVPTLIGISLITFFVSHVVPGDPARLVAGLEAPTEAVQALREEMGLDHPVPIQYLEYMSRLVRGDLGQSVINRRPVADNLRDYFPATVELTLTAFTIAAFLGVLLGIITALKKDGFLDNALRFASMAGVAFPVFWVGIILLLIFYFKLGWVPAGGQVDAILFSEHKVQPITHLLLVDSTLAGNWLVFGDALKHLALPAITASLGPIARFMRFTRSVMLDVLGESYIRTARAKGLTERMVVVRHALRNAMIPTTTLMGMSIGYMLGGSVLIETIFDWPGLGKYAYDSIIFLDYPAIMGVTLLATVVFMLCNLAVDVIYVYLDPRIKYV